MGRGGERVGGNWRGVALTHQATVYKNKNLWAGKWHSLFYTSSPSTKRTAETKKNDICFISGTDLTHFVVFLSLSLSLAHSSKFPSCVSLINQNFLSLPLNVTGSFLLSYLLLSSYLVRIWVHILHYMYIIYF